MIDQYYCPVSGLPVYTRPAWLNQRVSETMTANFYVLGDAIIYSRPVGVADLAGLQGSLQLNAEIEALVSGGTGLYVQIEDYAELNGATRAARRYFIEVMNQRDRCLSLLFCNLSLLMSVAVDVGSRFNTTTRDVYVDRHYPAAINRAVSLCQTHQVPLTPISLVQVPCFDCGLPSLSPVHLLADPAWDVQTSTLTNRAVVLNRHILHSSAVGILEPAHVAMLVDQRHQCRLALSESDAIDYLVVNAADLSGGSSMARIRYIHSLLGWHQDFPLRMYLVYGGSPYARTGALLARPLAPFKVDAAYDADQAFKLIHQDQTRSTPAKPTERDIAVSSPNRQHVDDLLMFMSQINWEQPGLAQPRITDETHPFYLLYQSIVLIKEEFDNLFAERTRVLEELQQSNNQLQETLTELEQTQEKLVQQERLAAVGQLAAGIAHDFNNILTSILGFTELMQMSPDVPASMQRHLTRVNTSSQRAAHLVRQLLDFSRKSIRFPQKLDLIVFTEEVIQFLQRTIPESITLHFVPGSEDYQIEADPTQLQQLITNLVVNARDSMPDGGRIQITLDLLQLDGEVTDSVSGQAITGSWIALTVADEGDGIAAEVLPHIFEPFYTTKDVGQGTGLGLSQVYGIVSQHAGYITVNSVLDQGTHITVYFPPLGPTELETETNTAAPLVTGRGETILLVEDETTVREAGKAMLELMGYHVLVAANGREALQVYQSHQTEVALVLSDMVMPDMGGDGLFKVLHERNPQLKMILMSGYPLGKQGADLLEWGLVDWFEKPITMKRLSQVIGQALAAPKSC